ncbi:hypothetical protein OAB00_04160 [Akkermansiaceae bacterium]|nr:hypothetical protein [Akkermansiaceae bacterium]
MKNNIKIALLSLSALALSSCASIVSKSDYPVAFNSAKSTTVQVKNQATGQTVYQGKTPSVATLPASQGFFQPARYAVTANGNTQPLNATLDGWYIGNLLFGGVIGGLIDPITGAMWKLPKTVFVGEGN